MAVIQSKMASAMVRAFHNAVAEGHNPGAVGKRILTNDMKGVGKKFQRTLTLKKEKATAVSAE